MKTFFKRALCFLLIHSFLLAHVTFATAFELKDSDLQGSSAILINADTGQILFGKAIHELMYPASTTKILTAIICIEDLDLNQVVEVDALSPYAGGSHIALEPGERVTIEQLVTALMIASANDAAEVLARVHSGSLEEFAKVMNERAAKMGAIHSNFVTPHGLHHNDHVTTAYDLAQISKYAMANETFKAISLLRRYEIPPTNAKTEARYLNSGTSLFPSMTGSNDPIVINGQRTITAYDYATGIKRGFTPEARYTFVGSSEVDGRSFISVVLRSEPATLFQDTRLLLEYGATSTKATLIDSKSLKVQSITLKNPHKETTIGLTVEHDVILDLPLASYAEDLVVEDDIDADAMLPVSEGEVLGVRSYYLNGERLFQVNLISDGTYLGENLLNADITHMMYEKDYLGLAIYVLIRLFIALLVWRTIMTVFHILKRKKRLASK